MVSNQTARFNLPVVFGRVLHDQITIFKLGGSWVESLKIQSQRLQSKVQDHVDEVDLVDLVELAQLVLIADGTKTTRPK